MLQGVPKKVNDGLGHRNASPQRLAPISKYATEKGPPEQWEASDPDLVFSCVGNEHPLIPPGDYEVSFVRATKKQLWGVHKVFLWFKIESFGTWQATNLFMPCKLETEGKISARSKYYRNWVVAAGRKPDRNERKRMSTRVFKGKLFLAKVVTVTKDQKNLPIPPLLKYSKIDGLINRLTA